MAVSIQAPNAVTPAVLRLVALAGSFITTRRARRIEADAIKQLRGLDPYLQHDLGLDREALWQLRPEIRALQTPYLVATSSARSTPKCTDDDQRCLLV
jgi:hypothetical protein